MFLRRPIDCLGEHSRALGDRRHRIDYDIAENAQFVDNSVAQRLVIDGTADKNYLVDVRRVQARFVNRRLRGVNRFSHDIFNRRVIIVAIKRHFKVNFFAVFVLNSQRVNSWVYYFGLFIGGKFNLRLFRRVCCDTQQFFVFVERAPIFGHGISFLKTRYDEFVQNNFVEIAPAAHRQAAVRKEIHFAANPFGNRNVESTAAHVEDQKFAVGLIIQPRSLCARAV